MIIDKEISQKDYDKEEYRISRHQLNEALDDLKKLAMIDEDVCTFIVNRRKRLAGAIREVTRLYNPRG